MEEEDIFGICEEKSKLVGIGIPCKDHYQPEPDRWLNSVGSVKSNGEDTLSINSILRCQFGGKISILKNGQNGQIDSIEFDRDSMKAFQWGFFTQIFRLNGMSVFESLFGEVGPHYYYQNFPGYGKGKYAADFVGLIESGAIYFGLGSIFVGGWLATIGTGGAGAAVLPVIDSVALAWWAHATMVGGQATAHLFSGEGWSGGKDFDKMEKLVDHPDVEVDWSNHSEHGMERLEQRGLSKEQIGDFVKNGVALEQNGGEKFAFITEDGVAVVSKDGKLVTAWGEKDFDDVMKRIVEELYGK